jgi:hypothetical protein
VSDPTPAPFDEQEFLRIIERIESAETAGLIRATQADVLRLAHLGKQLLTETIRLRSREQVARQRALDLEQGQTLLPLSQSTATNQPVPHHA